MTVSPTRPEILDHFDPHDQATIQSVIDHYDYARSQCPVHRSDAHGGFWLVTPYELVNEVLRDWKTYSSANGVLLPTGIVHRHPPIDCDPPDQLDYRRFLLPLFTNSRVATYEAVMREVVINTIENFADDGRCDALKQFSAPFTATTLIRTVLDVEDPSGIVRIQELVSTIAEENSEAGWTGVFAYAGELMAQRRTSAESRDDLINAVLTGTVAGRPLTEEEQLGIIIIFILGGLDTTKAGITNTILRMAQRPGLEQELRDPERLAASISELLRFDSPIIGFARTVTRDVVLGGQQLREGDVVFVSYASANRDEAVFEDPQELRLDRAFAQPHLAFGAGIHKCIGRHLARLQINVAISELLTRVTDIRLEAGVEIEWVAGHVRYPAALPITFTKTR